MLFFFIFYSLKIPEKRIVIFTKILSSTNQHISKISEGSCDTKDWSNDSENLAFVTGINLILKYFKTGFVFIKLL